MASVHIACTAARNTLPTGPAHTGRHPAEKPPHKKRKDDLYHHHAPFATNTRSRSITVVVSDENPAIAGPHHQNFPYSDRLQPRQLVTDICRRDNGCLRVALVEVLQQHLLQHPYHVDWQKTATETDDLHAEHTNHLLCQHVDPHRTVKKLEWRSPFGVPFSRSPRLLNKTSAR